MVNAKTENILADLVVLANLKLDIELPIGGASPFTNQHLSEEGGQHHHIIIFNSQYKGRQQTEAFYSTSLVEEGLRGG